MRYLVGSVCVLVLSLMPMLGCAEVRVGDDGGSGTGGTGGAGGTGGNGGTVTCDGTACLFCPPESLDPLVAAWFPDGLLVSFQFFAIPQSDLVQGRTSTVVIDAAAVGSEFPVEVIMSISDASTLTYDVTSGGTGTADIPVPEQTLVGTELFLDLGFGTIDVTADVDATEAVVELSEAVFFMALEQPASIVVTLEANDSGPCSMLGDGVRLPVGPS